MKDMSAQTRVNEQSPEAGVPPALHEPDIKHYFRTLRQRVWIVVTCFVIIVTLGVVYAFKSTSIYRATAKMLIERQAPRVIGFRDVLGRSQPSDKGYFNYYYTQKEIIESRIILQKAVEQPGIQDLIESADGDSRPSLMGEIKRTISAAIGGSPDVPAEPWEKLQEVMDVDFVRNTQLLQINVEDREPVRAARLANAIARAFEQYHVECKRKTSNDAFLFLKQQQIVQANALHSAEKALQEFRQQTEVVSFDVRDENNAVLVRHSKLNEQLIQVGLARIELAAKSKVVEQGFSAVGSNPSPGDKGLFLLPSLKDFPTVPDMRRELVKAEKELAQLSVFYGPGAPQLRAVQSEVRILGERLRDALEHVRRSLLTELEVLNRQEMELQEQYAEQNQCALDLARESLTYDRLRREVNRQGKLLDILMERMREVDLSGDYAKTNVEIVEPADVPRLPVKPRKLAVLAVSIFLGLLLGGGLAFLAEYLDDTIKTPEDLESRVGVPVLGFVPGGSGNEQSAAASMVALLEPKSTITEAYRNIRTNLFFSAPAEEARVLCVTSGGSGDGKTTVSCNLAVVMAQSGKKVLLIDGDLRRSKVRESLNLESGPGLSNVLVGGAELEEVVQSPRGQGDGVVENLDVLIAGPKPPNPAELLGGEGMGRLLAKVREKYDRVIIDTPALLLVADGGIVAGISDGVIVVVKAGSNSRALVKRTRMHLQGVKARVLGGILNDVRVSRIGYYHSDYYYYGYYGAYRSHYQSDDEALGQDEV